MDDSNLFDIGFGGIKRPYDVRDLKHVGKTGAPIVYPETFESTVTTIYNQGKYPTCGAHAGAQVANVLFNIESSPKFLWKIIKTIDGFALEDGTDMRSIFKALQKVGICTIDKLDNSLEGSLEEYSNPKTLTQEMYDNAALHKISTYSFNDYPTIPEVKAAVYEYGVVLLLVDIGDGWYIPSWEDKDVNPLHLGKFVGRHFIVATKYGYTVISGPNSWSAKWGDKGFFKFDSGYSPHLLEMGVATIPTGFKFTKDIKYGETSADVRELQIKLGMQEKNWTGYFGFLTLCALFKYQYQNGIRPYSGVVHQTIRDSLNAI